MLYKIAMNCSVKVPETAQYNRSQQRPEVHTIAEPGGAHLDPGGGPCALEVLSVGSSWAVDMNTVYINIKYTLYFHIWTEYTSGCNVFKEREVSYYTQ